MNKQYVVLGIISIFYLLAGNLLNKHFQRTYSPPATIESAISDAKDPELGSLQLSDFVARQGQGFNILVVDSDCSACAEDRLSKFSNKIPNGVKIGVVFVSGSMLSEHFLTTNPGYASVASNGKLTKEIPVPFYPRIYGFDEDGDLSYIQDRTQSFSQAMSQILDLVSSFGTVESNQ